MFGRRFGGNVGGAEEGGERGFFISENGVGRMKRGPMIFYFSGYICSTVWMKARGYRLACGFPFTKFCSSIR